jgi:hypothetical protein
MPLPKSIHLDVDRLWRVALDNAHLSMSDMLRALQADILDQILTTNLNVLREAGFLTERTRPAYVGLVAARFQFSATKWNAELLAKRAFLEEANMFDAMGFKRSLVCLDRQLQALGSANNQFILGLKNQIQSRRINLFNQAAVDSLLTGEGTNPLEDYENELAKIHQKVLIYHDFSASSLGYLYGYYDELTDSLLPTAEGQPSALKKYLQKSYFSRFESVAKMRDTYDRILEDIHWFNSLTSSSENKINPVLVKKFTEHRDMLNKALDRDFKSEMPILVQFFKQESQLDWKEKQGFLNFNKPSPVERLEALRLLYLRSCKQVLACVSAVW